MERICKVASMAIVSLVGLTNVAFSQTETETLRSLVPQEIAERGYLRVGIETNSAPMEYEDLATGVFTGFNPELLTAIGETLGLRIDFQISDVPSLTPALDSGRIDMIGSQLADISTRRHKWTFVDYLRSGPTFYTVKDLASEYSDISKLCGKSVGGVQHAIAFEVMKAWSAANCAADNQVDVIAFKGSADIRLQIKQGRIVAGTISAEASVPWKTNPKAEFSAIGTVLHTQFYGYPVLKSNEKLRDAVVGALNVIRASGRYDALLEKYDLKANGLENFTVDGGPD